MSKFVPQICTCLLSIALSSVAVGSEPCSGYERVVDVELWTRPLDSGSSSSGSSSSGSSSSGSSLSSWLSSSRSSRWKRQLQYGFRHAGVVATTNEGNRCLVHKGQDYARKGLGRRCQLMQNTCRANGGKKKRGRTFPVGKRFPIIFEKGVNILAPFPRGRLEIAKQPRVECTI